MTYVPPPPMKFAGGSSVIVPRVRFRTFHGISVNEPSSQYVKIKHEASPKLDDSLLTVGVNDKLTTGYPLAADTGIIPVDETTKHLLADLKQKPHLSRDGGKGGYLNGQKLFLFCDTGAYTPAFPGKPGDFLGFVSGSVAVDKGGKGTNSEPLVLEDGVGQWSDDAGRMRGMSPLTAGEQSYNQAMQGKGQRYAIWPESSIVPFNHTHALLYGAIVYDNVNRATKKTVFTYTGTTLLTITAPVASGPRADRLVEKLFTQEEVEWGTIGAFRSYGASGQGGNDGRVYVLGKASGGLLIGRVDADKIEDRGSYTYWNGQDWTSDMQPRSSTAYFIKGSYMDGDLIYSPIHLTFIFIYLTPWADSIFFYRYLKSDKAIRPSTDGSYDFAENLVKYEWSEEQMLYKAPNVPDGKYIYAGGAHQGYYDNEDLSNGGRMTLLSWTVSTGKEPGEVESEYSHVTAHVEWE
ncbi:MAG: hypothetical protein M1823_001355 [Watsoniomyces obsoletus]|nr:MAG: hypothetical protein M1823_001355 [Watsoniomyces obsoletus]